MRLVGRSVPCVEFVGNLTTDATWAASRGAEVVAGASLDPVLISQIPPHDEEWDAGRNAGQEDVEASTLTHTLCILVGLTREAEVPAHAVSAISAHAITGAILPLLSSAAVSTASFALTFAPAFAFTHDGK